MLPFFVNATKCLMKKVLAGLVLRCVTRCQNMVVSNSEKDNNFFNSNYGHLTNVKLHGTWHMVRGMRIVVLRPIVYKN